VVAGTPGDTGRATAVSPRVLTVPNALSALRLLGVPVFLYLLLGPHADGWAITVLAVSGVTDYLDGAIARRYGLVSRVGQLLDPIADRLYTVTTVLALTARGILPLYLTLILLSRDLFMFAVVGGFRRAGYAPPAVSFMGKAATYNLLYAFPLLLLGAGHDVAATVARPLGWAFATWGTALYWWSAWLYARQWRGVVGRPPAMERAAS
jgi:cardiolipin synthase